MPMASDNSAEPSSVGLRPAPLAKPLRDERATYRTIAPFALNSLLSALKTKSVTLLHKPPPQIRMLSFQQ
jgi:hypothetical protein